MTDLFRLAQAAWQDALLFFFAFLLAVGLAGASEHVFLAFMRMSAGGGGASSSSSMAAGAGADVGGLGGGGGMEPPAAAASGGDEF